MIIVMKAGAADAEIDRVVGSIRDLGYEPRMIRGVERTVIAVVGDERGKAGKLANLESFPGVESLMPVLKPYKLASREGRPDPSVVRVGPDVTVGGRRLAIMAGPCSVESEGQLLETAEAVKAAGANILRGGAFKPRTSPYAFQGLEHGGLRLLDRARRETGMPVITEVLNPQDIDAVAEHADILQVGARNAQNFALLKQLGRQRKPVFLKRGMSMTIQEFLMAAEYVMSEGNPDVILCERGIRTFETATRNTLDLGAVAVLKEQTHLPVVVDPSHATGHWQYVAPLACAGIAAGADGLMIEVHPRPDQAESDGPQSLKPARFAALMEKLKLFAEAAGRSL
jgi:3-deoxy-7-phosphoheptulonate synthase